MAEDGVAKTGGIRKVGIAAAVVLSILAASILFSTLLPSVEGSALFRNETDAQVVLHYSGGGLLDRGDVALEPGEQRAVRVFNGDDYPSDGFSFRVVVSRPGHDDESLSISGCHPRRHWPIVRVRDEDVVVENGDVE